MQSAVQLLQSYKEQNKVMHLLQDNLLLQLRLAAQLNPQLNQPAHLTLP
jgi:hypothetical protein